MFLQYEGAWAPQLPPELRANIAVRTCSGPSIKEKCNVGWTCTALLVLHIKGMVISCFISC